MEITAPPLRVVWELSKFLYVKHEDVQLPQWVPEVRRWETAFGGLILHYIWFLSWPRSSSNEIKECFSENVWWWRVVPTYKATGRGQLGLLAFDYETFSEKHLWQQQSYAFAICRNTLKRLLFSNCPGKSQAFPVFTIHCFRTLKTINSGCLFQT